jgi:hypothetical protein
VDCSTVENTFVVADGKTMVAAAKLILCGAEVLLGARVGIDIAYRVSLIAAWLGLRDGHAYGVSGLITFTC